MRTKRMKRWSGVWTLALTLFCIISILFTGCAKCRNHFIALHRGGLHSKRYNFVKPADEAIDLLDFCPWTGGFSSGSIVYKVQGKSTTIKSCNCAVDVLQGNGLLSSLQSARKPVPVNNSKLSFSPIAQLAK